ncbi:MAG: type II toxin-antitoxin system RelE/ParE family toxin [Methylococcaceae bacterium]
MPRLLKRPEAKNDLEEIWWFIAQDSPDNADKFFDRIQDSCLTLADFPSWALVGRNLKPLCVANP